MRIRPYLMSLGVLMTSVAMSYASMVGPWFRYDCGELGFQIPIASGWRVTRVSDAVVFAMQSQPDPYVRVAIGRLELGPTELERIVQTRRRAAQGLVRRSEVIVDGRIAVKLEGRDANGPFLDVFVPGESSTYWIGFTADSTDLWPQYSKTFDIVIEGFHFLPLAS